MFPIGYRGPPAPMFIEIVKRSCCYAWGGPLRKVMPCTIENVDETTFRLPPDAHTLLDWLIKHAHPSVVKELLESNVDIVISRDLNKDPTAAMQS